MLGYLASLNTTFHFEYLPYDCIEPIAQKLF